MATAIADALTVPEVVLSAARTFDRPLLRVIAHNILRVTFSIDMATDTNLFNTANYQIARTSTQAREVQVVQVRGIQNAEEGVDIGFARIIDLLVTQPSLDTVYNFTAENIYTADGKVFTDAYASFVAHSTKGDTILSWVPPAFALNDQAALRHVLLALAIEDDRIGGGDNLIALPEDLGETESQNLGSGVLGTMTIGGED